MNEGLRNKTLFGLGWSAVDGIASQGITFLVGLVLARLLSPEEFGLIGIITIFITISNTIVDSGFSNSIIRKPIVIDEDYSTTFISNLGISIVIYAVLFVCSPCIASFFHNNQLIILSRVLGVVIIINSLAIVQRTKLVREIDFKRQAKISVISSLISGIIGIVLAFCGIGIWALVAQQITRQAINSVGLWFSAHWIPSFRFSTESFKYQFKFGWKLMLSQLLNTVWNEANHMVIGRCYSSAILGQYSRAHQFSSILSSNMTGVIQRVSFPVLSSIQEDVKRLKANYRKLIKVTMLLSFVGMLSLAACAKPLIYVLVGEKWAIAAEYLPIICFNMMLYPIRAINTNMLQVLGRTDQLLVLEIIKKLFGLFPLFLGVYVGILWMLWGNVFVGIIGFILNSAFSGRRIKYSLWQQVVDILPSLIFGVIVALSVFSVSYFGLSYMVTLVIQVFVGILMIFLLGEMTQMESYLELKNILISTIRRN